MADKICDKPDEKTLRASLRRAAGPDIVAGMKNGAISALTLNNRHNPEMWASIPALAAMAAGPMMALYVYGGENVTVPADPVVATAAAEGGVSSVLVRDGPNEVKYTLIQGPNGYEIYRSGDYSDADDRLQQLAAPAQALAATSAVVAALQGVQDAAQGNLLAMPDAKAMPSFVTYARISPVYAEPDDPRDIYRVGDEVQVDTTTLRLADVTHHLAQWRQAAVAIAGGAYTPTAARASAHHLHNHNLLPQAFATIVATYAGFAGLGALGGAAIAIRRNRKTRTPKV